MTELTAPTKFTGRRYSVAVAIPSGEQHLVELGTSVHATVARNMDSEVFTVSSNKDSSEYLEMLRERKKSRSQLTKAHTLAKSLDLDGGLHESSPKPGMPVSPPKMKKSIPLIRLEDEEDEVEEGDIISKLVGRNSLLSTPTRNNRKVSLQEELCGMSPRQDTRPVRASVAGDIVSSVDSSQLNNDSVSPNHPYRGMPNIPGLIIPDRWKSDNPPLTKQDSMDSCSSDLSSGVDTDDDNRIGLTFEPRPSDPQPSYLPEALPSFSDTLPNASTEPEPHFTILPSCRQQLGSNLSVSDNKLLTESEKELTAGEDCEAKGMHSERVKKRKSSSERRRSQPEMNHYRDSEDETSPPLQKQSTAIDPLQNTGTSLDVPSRHKVSSRLNIKKKKKASTTNPEKSLDTFLASETEDLLLSIEEGEPYDSSLTNVSERVKSCSNSDPSVTSSVPDMEKDKVVEVCKDGKILKKPRTPFKYVDMAAPATPSPVKRWQARPGKKLKRQPREDQNKQPIYRLLENSEELKLRLREMQEEMAKSDLIIAELNITIEDLKEYNTKLESDIQSDYQSKESQRSEKPQLDFDMQSDEWLNLEIEVARLQNELVDRETIIRTQKEALDKALSKGGSSRQISLAGAAKQALDINVNDMARKYNENLQLCKDLPVSVEKEECTYQDKLRELEKTHYALVEQLGVRHTEEMETLRNDYEVLLEHAVKEKESEMRNTIIENEEMEDLAAQVDELSTEVNEKDKQIECQSRSIASLSEEISILQKTKPPSSIPKIIIEDPNGNQQCYHCTKKSAQILELEENLNQKEDKCASVCSNAAEEFSAIEQESNKIKEDVNLMKSEMNTFVSEIKIAITSYTDLQKEVNTVSIGSQTLVTHKTRILPTPHQHDPNQEKNAKSAQTSVTNVTANPEDQAAKFKIKEDRYKRDLFELKVKLKELEAKMIHLKKKAEQMKSNNQVEIPLESVSNEKLQEMVHDREKTLQQVRLLHGQNLATMRKRHDKVVGSLQETIDQLEATLQQFVPWYGSLDKVDKASTDRISVTCRQGRFSACTVIADNLSQH